ncbi:MAG TPA: DUF5919 domain-containing protein [Actinospica sp.]|nr:DUF5919 domain-containing protein [Actinospica sp.]
MTLLPFGWMLRLSRWYTRKPKLVGFSALVTLIIGLSLGAVITGFTNGFWPNLLLNSAGDMIGGLVILMMIEPIVSRAAVQIRQHAHLDFRLFARRITAAEREIRVLDTYSGLFDTTNGLRSLPALHDAVLRGVHVKVLLMSPATDASRLRQEQLESAYPGLSIDGQIHNNISALGTMEQQLADAMRRLGAPQSIPMIGGDSEDTGVYVPRVVEFAGETPAALGSFELRLYSVAAPFTLYQRDNTILFALLPAYQFAHDAPQLEIAAGSLTGMQVLEKFDELWEDSRPVRRLAAIRLSPAEDTEPMWVRYLELGDETYHISNRIDAALAVKPDQHFWLGEHGGVEHEAEPVPTDSTLHRQLLELHDRKYTAARRREPTFYLMWPSSELAAPRGRTLDFDRLPTGQILQRLAEAERTVRILDTSSILIGQDGDAAGAEAFVQAALRAMSNGATIRILLLAPTTSAARERAKEIRDTHFDQMVERNIQRLRQLAAQLPSRGIEPERLRVRLYDQLPEISVHQIDDRVLVGFLPYRRRSSMTSQLETERHSELGVYAVGQFEQLWTRARPLDGLRYVILRTQSTAVQGERLLVRAWQVGQTWFVASARIEELVAARTAERQAVHAWIEEAPGAQFWLSEPLDREESTPIWDAFARLYGAADPGVPIRALDRVE